MDEVGFWKLIAQLDWSKTGDDDAVCAPVVAALAAQPVEAIEAFEELLAQKLHALDTEAHAREIGEEAFEGSKEHFSADWFLYVRCCVVANGRKTYEAVLADPKRMPKDMEFEALLQIASAAFEQKTGRPFEFTASVSYETFANTAGWRPATSPARAVGPVRRVLLFVVGWMHVWVPLLFVAQCIAPGK